CEPRRPAGADAAAVSRPRRLCRRRQRRMGSNLARRRGGRLHPFLLQHHSDPGRRDPRSWSARRAVARDQGVWRAGQQPPRGAGGSAKQARARETQAILPLRGKILNVASASADKMRGNQELSDIILALGAGSGAHYREETLRYERVVIMTDADVDGAHIASLLMTFFFREMPKLVENGHLFLALPPLYRLTQGELTLYARDDAHREELLQSAFT